MTSSTHCPKCDQPLTQVGRNPLVEMLARHAQRSPDWLGLVVASQPEFDVKAPLQALNLFPFDTQSESNHSERYQTTETCFATTTTDAVCPTQIAIASS